MVAGGDRRALVDPKSSSSRWLENTRVVPGHCGAISTDFHSPATPMERNEIAQLSTWGQAKPDVSNEE